jgi:hypothetical protein
MAQKEEQILPLFIQVDNAPEALKPTESPFIKGMGFDQNGNPSEEAGETGGTGEGYNALIQTPVRSNQVYPQLPADSLPAGINKNFGSFESLETDELYYANWNSEGNHGLYVIDFNTGQWNTVVVDTNLPFTEKQEDFLAEHRWSIRFVYDANRKIVAKFLLFTNGAGWQGWINVTAAIATQGFNAQLFPYWTLTPPHFDRRELLEWAMRPPMDAPLVATVPNTPADADKINRLIDTAFQVAYRRRNTDGRQSTASPYSLPLIIKSEDYLNNPDTLPKNALFTFDAGSCMTESVDIFIRKNLLNKNSIPSIIEWSDWYLYDTIYKFSGSDTSESSVLSTPYWNRTNPWSSYNYDPNLNTIQYSFDNSRSLTAVDQVDFGRLQNDIPQKSWGLTDVGDAALLINNRRDYDNMPDSVLSKISAQVVEKSSGACAVPTRKIQLYAYIGMMTDSSWYISQVGYINGADTTVRFGGLNFGSGTTAGIDFNISKAFDLTFADKQAFRCYLKGTPYYVDGQWYQVNSDFSLVKIENLLDLSNTDVLTYVRNVYTSGGYFVCVFNFTVPAGRYIATIGRHNVASSGDFQNTSTYITGIADSRKTTAINSQTVSVTPTAIGSYSKEMEIDCTAADVDVWGNGKDLFYIFCPYISSQNFRFFEGYWQESPSTPIGVELYPYTVVQGTTVGANDWGRLTDKNGFYWAYYIGDHAGNADIHIQGNINCAVADIDIKTSQGGPGWRQNPTAYLSDHNNGIVGDCNRIVYNGKITSLDGTIGYSNISVSIKDGATAVTNDNGIFTLIIHNGQSTFRQSNVYVNAAGNFLVTISNCGQIPVTQFNEALVPCSNCNVRVYPVPLNLKVVIQDSSQTSLKQGGKYSVAFEVADLAGRVSFVNIVGQFPVSSFIERQDTAATFFRMLILSALKLNLLNPDFKWFAPVISKNLTDPTFTEWVADYIEYIDNNGNVVSDPSMAVFCSIGITSLYNYNVQRNFSTLANYQFKDGDRLRIYDDGNGTLLTSVIDLKVLGQNYNQAAMAADLLPNNNTVPIINTTINNSTTTSVTDGTGKTTVSVETQQNNQNITLYVLFDPRLVPLINSKGFWIELYTPADQSSILEYSETQGFYPIINGEVCKYTGKVNGQPTYEPLTQIDLTFWDTYLFPRNITIPNVGDKFFSHPFESPNVSDTFGSMVSSGGRKNFNNSLAKQMWYSDEVIKSDDFASIGILNGVGTFRSANRKSFKDFKSGPLMLAKSYRNTVLFICENDFFVTDYNFQYIYANAQGVQIANLDNNLGSPHQKVGSRYGIAPEDTGTFVALEDFASWYDRKNQDWIMSDYRTAKGLGLFNPDEGSAGGLSSYIYSKTKAISSWNKQATDANKFDVIGGVDMERWNLYLTFRPRRNNSNDPTSYGSTRRNIDLLHQETVVYNLITKRFVRWENFTPEAYGKMRGRAVGMQLVTFAAGIPYIHNSGNSSFNNFYGVQYDAVIAGVFNQNQEANKIFSNVVLDINGPGMYIDFLRTNEPNSFSYLPMSRVKLVENKYELTLLRNMNSYFAPIKENAFRSTLIDGKRIFNLYLLLRLVSDPNSKGKYFELKRIYNMASDSTNEKK